MSASTAQLDSQFHPKVNKLVSLAEYIATLKRQPKKQLKTDKERKKWLKETCPDIKYVKHPTTGKESIPVEKETLMLVGKKTSASRSKEEEFTDRSEAKAAAKRATEAIEVATNTKAGWNIGPLVHSDFQVGSGMIHMIHIHDSWWYSRVVVMIHDGVTHVPNQCLSPEPPVYLFGNITSHSHIYSQVDSQV